MRLISWLCWLTSLAAMLTAAPASARPHDPRWYRLVVHVDPASLPPGVTVTVTERGLPGEVQLHWANRSATPLLLVRTLPGPLDWLGVIPDRHLPALKLVGGEAFEWTNEGWRSLGPAITTDELYAAMGLRPFDREFKRRPLPKGRATIRRRIRIPCFAPAGGAAARRHELVGTVEFEVDYDTQGLIATRDHFDAPPPPALLRYGPGRVGSLANPGRTPVYFAVPYPARIGWLGSTPANELPCYRLARGRVAYPVTFQAPQSFRRPALTSGWVEDEQDTPLTLPLSGFARAAGVKLHLERSDRDGAAPANQPLPAAQTLRVPTRYGGQAQVVRVVVSYARNDPSPALSPARPHWD